MSQVDYFQGENMQRLIHSLVVLLLVGSNAIAMEGEGPSNVDHNIGICVVIQRDGWGARAPVASKLDKHKGPVSRIIVGHTVTCLKHDDGTIDSAGTLRRIQSNHMDNEGWADIGYNCCLSPVKGVRYNCRPLDIQPSIIRGQNTLSCAVGLINRYDNHDDAGIITDDLVNIWGKQFAGIAFELGFTELVPGKDGNIVTMMELKPEQYPVSPGIRFMARYAEIIKVANEELNRLLERD